MFVILVVLSLRSVMVYIPEDLSDLKTLWMCETERQNATLSFLFYLKVLLLNWVF